MMQKEGVFDLSSIVPGTMFATPKKVVEHYFNEAFTQCIPVYNKPYVMIDPKVVDCGVDRIAFFHFEYESCIGQLSIKKLNVWDAEELVKKSIFFKVGQNDFTLEFNTPKKLEDAQLDDFAEGETEQKPSLTAAEKEAMKDADIMGNATSQTKVWMQIERDLVFNPNSVVAPEEEERPAKRPKKNPAHCYTTFSIRAITDPDHVNWPGYPKGRFDPPLVRFFRDEYETDPRKKMFNAKGVEIPKTKAKVLAEEFSLTNGIPCYAYDLSPHNGAKGYFCATDKGIREIYHHPERYTSNFDNFQSILCINEVLGWLDPTKPFFDLDAYPDNNPHLKETVDSLTWETIDFVNELFEEVCGVKDVTREDWSILHSDRPGKISRHVMCHNEKVMFRSMQCYEYFMTILLDRVRTGWKNEDERMLKFRLRDKDDAGYMCWIDDAVISRFRSFRMYRMSKMGKDNQLLFLMGKRCESKLDYLIQRPFSGTFDNLDNFVTFHLDGREQFGNFMVKYDKKDNVIAFYRKSDKKRKLGPFIKKDVKMRPRNDGMIQGLSKESSFVVHEWLRGNPACVRWLEDGVFNDVKIKRLNADRALIDITSDHTFCYSAMHTVDNPEKAYHSTTGTMIMVQRDANVKTRFFSYQSCFSPGCKTNPKTGKNIRKKSLGIVPAKVVKALFN